LENLEQIEKSGKFNLRNLAQPHFFPVGLFSVRNHGSSITSQKFRRWKYRVYTAFGFGAVRGPSTRSGTSAFGFMISLDARGFADVFTVDGPKGVRCMSPKTARGFAGEENGESGAFFDGTARTRTVLGQIADSRPLPAPGVFFFARPVLSMEMPMKRD